MPKISDIWEKEKPKDFNDTLEKRLDFVESICVDDDGTTVDNAVIHEIMQRKVFKWENEGINKGLVRVPYGVGKSTQFTQALNLYHLTLNPNHLIIILASKPSSAKSRVKWIRNIIENSNRYKRWCEEHGLRPLELSDQDTGSNSKIYVKRDSTSPHPSVSGHGVNEGGTGWRATRITPDDIVDRKNSRFEKDREKVWGNWKDTWSQRLKPNGVIHGVFTPYHPKDTNMKMLDTGLYAELKIRVAEDKSCYEMFEKRPTEGKEKATKLVDKDFHVPLWSEGGHDQDHYQSKEDEDETSYARGYRMEEDVAEKGDTCYQHYNDDYYPKGNVTATYDFQPTGASVYLAMDFNYDPQCWSMLQRQGKHKIVFDELRKEASTTQVMAQAMAEKLKNYKPRPINHVRIIGDATPREGREGFSDYDTIKDVFNQYNIQYEILTRRSNPSVLNSITLLNKGLCNSQGHRELLIHERCEHVRRDLRKVERGKDGKPVDKDSDLTHFSDGLRYYWWYIKKTRQTRTLPNLRGRR